MKTGLTTFETGFGWIGVQVGDGVIRRTAIGYSSRDALLNCFDAIDPDVGENCADLVTRFQRFTTGDIQSLDDLEIDETWMTSFQRRVVRACRRIPWGETVTYGQLAEAAGSPRASQSAGTVMAGNRFPLVVPCHRVLGRNGLGGFSAPDGVQLKRRLLANEGGLPDKTILDRTTRHSIV